MTSKNENKELLTKKNQPIKTITQQRYQCARNNA